MYVQGDRIFARLSGATAHFMELRYKLTGSPRVPRTVVIQLWFQSIPASRYSALPLAIRGKVSVKSARTMVDAEARCFVEIAWTATTYVFPYASHTPVRNHALNNALNSPGASSANNRPAPAIEIM